MGPNLHTSMATWAPRQESEYSHLTDMGTGAHRDRAVATKRQNQDSDSPPILSTGGNCQS